MPRAAPDRGSIPLAQQDATLFKSLMAGERCLHGFTNRDIREDHFPNVYSGVALILFAKNKELTARGSMLCRHREVLARAQVGEHPAAFGHVVGDN